MAKNGSKKWLWRRIITIGSLTAYFSIVFASVFYEVPSNLVSDMNFVVMAIIAGYFGGSSYEHVKGK